MVGVVVVLFVGLVVFVGVMVEFYFFECVVVVIKFMVVWIVVNVIMMLWIYMLENMDILVDWVVNYFSGDFVVQYCRFVDQIVVVNKQVKIINDIEVIGVVVELLSGWDVVVIVYINIMIISLVIKNILVLKYLFYWLFMKCYDVWWLVIRMMIIILLDLMLQVQWD